MTRSNDNLIGGGKAMDAHERNQNRPDEAQHHDLKDQPGEKGDPDHTEEE